MKVRKLLAVCLSCLFIVFVSKSPSAVPFFIPQPFAAVNIPMLPNLSFSAMYPSDGDSYWTEGNNLTLYSKIYSADILSWTSSEYYYGSQALNWTHANSATISLVYLIATQQFDVSNYEYLYAKIKLIYSTYANNLVFYMQDTGAWDASAPYLSWGFGSGRLPQNEWVTLAIPLHNAKLINGASRTMFSTIRIMRFDWGIGTSASKAQLIIDGLRFANISLPSSDLSYDAKTLLNNAMYFIEESEETVTYSGQTYTMPHTSQNSSTGVYSDDTLEQEAVAQVIYGLTWAYEYSGYSDFLTKAELYAQLPMAIQDQSSEGYIPKRYTVLNTCGTTYLGWNLAAFSMLYKHTNNSTYKTVADNLVNFLIRTDRMWNTTAFWFNKEFDNSTKIVTKATTLDLMRSGAAATGLALYYRYVFANSSIQTVLDAVLNNIMTFSSACFVYKQASWHIDTTVEDSQYATPAFWHFYKATDNTTYRDFWVDTVLRYYEHRLITNGGYLSYNKYGFYKSNSSATAGSSQHEDWGMVNAILSLTLGYEDSAYQTRILDALKYGLENYVQPRQTAYGAWVFRGAGMYDTYSYSPLAAYPLAVLMFYFNKVTQTQPVLTYTTGNITAITSGNNTLTISLYKPVGKSSITKIYCADKGKPVSISPTLADGGYDSETKIQTITWTHASSRDFILDWNPTESSGGSSSLEPSTLTETKN